MERLAWVAAACAGLALGWVLLAPARSDRWRLRSGALAKTRRILVHLPEGYEASPRAWPLVVLLDGGDQKQFSGDTPLYSRSVAVLAALEKDGLPPMILVEIENRDRVRDMTPIERPDIYVGGGGSLAFMRFLETEVVPFVEQRWRVGSPRVLYGESYGGLLVLDALARGSHAFTDYVAVSPAVGVWPDGLADALGRKLRRMSPPVPGAGGAPRDDEPCRSSGRGVSSLFIVAGERDAQLVTEYMPPLVRAVEPGARAAVRPRATPPRAPATRLQRRSIDMMRTRTWWPPSRTRSISRRTPGRVPQGLPRPACRDVNERKLLSPKPN